MRGEIFEVVVFLSRDSSISGDLSPRINVRSHCAYFDGCEVMVFEKSNEYARTHRVKCQGHSK